MESQNLKRAISRIKSFFNAYKKGAFALIGFLALAYVGWLFYSYALRVSVLPPAGQIAKKVSIDSVLYQKVAEELIQRQANFDAEPGRIYQDPFR